MIDLSLLHDFIIEANEHLEEMESSLLKLEKDPDDKEIMNDIFRAIHTIKGASMFVGLPMVSELSHKMENLLDLLRQGEKELSQDITDTLIDTKDRLSRLCQELEETQEESSEIDDLLERILALSGVDEKVAEIESANDSEKEAPQEETDLASTLEEALDTSMLDGELDTSILGDDIDTSILADAEGLVTDESIAPVDSQEETSEATGPVSTEDIRQELAEESYDEELFGIFIQQSGNNFSEIRALAAKDVDPKTSGELLERCKTCLGNLRSSANYMGYANLVRFYDNWQTELFSAISDAESDADISLDFISSYLDQLGDAIPQLTDVNGAASEADRAEAKVAVDDSSVELMAIDEDAIKEEISGEVYDEELFTIFTQQVKTNITAIRKSLADFKTSADQTALLDSCAKSLANLKSSANYMGYNHLVNFYNNWLAETDSGDQDSEIGFINNYLDRAITLFADTIQLVEEESADIFAAEAASEGVETAAEDEDDLFATLSGSVDTAMENVAGAGVESLHSILEEMLLGEESDEAPAPKAKKKPVVEAKIKKEAPAAPEKPAEPAKPERRKEDRRQEEDRRLGGRRKESGERAFKQSIRVDSEKIDSLMNQVGELVVSRAYFAQISNYLRDLQQELKDVEGFSSKALKPIRELSFKLGEATVGLGRVSNELQEGVMRIRMLPVSQLFNRYPRLVRDLVRKTDKKVDLVIKGEDTELDKMVIEEISDPMIHIIRNAVDHGLESPKERKKAGKPKTGTLTLEAYHESNHIVIDITDDGRGIDIDKVKKKALQKGLISKEEMKNISDVEARRFIMMPGFSTADTPTETSGRGVGMDVIKTNIEKLNGTVEVDSEPGVFTRIRIKIPLTLAIIQALMIRVGKELFTLPLSVVEETLRIHEHETSTIEGVEVIHLRDTTMPIFRLADLFNIEEATRDIEQSFVVIVTTGMQEIGIVVDELIGQEEVVIKPLVDYLREDSGFSGATIIGDGRISLILDIYELVRMTADKQIARAKKHSARRGKKKKVIKAAKKAPAKTAAPENLQ